MHLCQQHHVTVQVISDYPLLIPAGALLLAVPLVGALVGGASQGAKVGPTSAARAVEALAEDERVIIVDIRSKESVKEYGTPDIRATKKKLNSVPFTKVKIALGKRRDGGGRTITSGWERVITSRN